MFETSLDTARQPIMIWEGDPIARTDARLKDLGVAAATITLLGNTIPTDNDSAELARQGANAAAALTQ